MDAIHRLIFIFLLVAPVNPQCYQKPTLVNPYSVSTLNEGQSSMKEITCFRCMCDGEEMQHYVIDLVRVNFPTYCRGCFTILNATSPIPNSKPNFCLFFIPGTTPVTYRRGPVFDMTVRCVVENTATTTIPTTTTTTQTTTTQTAATFTTVVTVLPTAAPTPDTATADTATTIAADTATTAAADTATTAAADTATTAAADTATTAATDTATTTAADTATTAAADTATTTAADTATTAAADTATTAAADTATTTAADTATTTAADTATTAATSDTTPVPTTSDAPTTSLSATDTASSPPAATTDASPTPTVSAPTSDTSASTTDPGTVSPTTDTTLSGTTSTDITPSGTASADTTATSDTTGTGSTNQVTAETATTPASTDTTLSATASTDDITAISDTTETVSTTQVTTDTTTTPTTVTTILTTTTPRPQFLTAEGTIQVRVIANQPPYFVMPAVTVSKNAVSVNDGGVVYKVDAIDPDGDPIFYTMSVDPLNSNFYIDGEGNIRAARTLRSECSAASYAFTITATDNKHDPVGPHLVTVHLTGTSTAPTAKNLNQEFFYKEDTRVPTFITKWSVSSDTKKTTMKFKPTNARTLFRVVGTTIRTAAKMDHEKFPKINITFTFSNDNCESKYYLLILIGNINDVPVLTPPEQSIKVDEGKVFAQPSYIITDSDFNDRHTFHFYRDRSRGYNIDPTTGAISHPTGIIIDKTVEQEVTFEVAVTDVNGPAISNKVLVKLLIQDINNNAPEFLVKSFTERVMSCSLPKRLDITLEVSDQDSSQNGNADWSVIPISSGPLSVTPDGAVYQTTNVVPGEVYFVEAFVRDHGTNPGSLTGTVPVTITLIGIPCTPAPTVIVATVATPAASGTGTGTGTGGTGSISISKTGSSSSSSSNSNSNSNSNTDTSGTADDATPTDDDGSDGTAGTVLGILFGLLLLAVLAYLLYKFVLPRFCPGAYDSLSYSMSNCSERMCPQKTNDVRPRYYQKGNNGYHNRPAPFQYYH